MVHSVKFAINNLRRELHIDVVQSVYIICADNGKVVEARKFNRTDKYPTSEDNIKRGMRYFKATDDVIEETLNWWEEEKSKDITPNVW